MTEALQRCTKCGCEKPCGEFHFDARYGRPRRVCKACHCAAQRERNKRTPRTPEQRAAARRRCGEVTVEYVTKAETMRRAAEKRADAEARKAERAARPKKFTEGSAEWYRVATPSELEAYRRKKREEYRRLYHSSPAKHRAKVKYWKRANPETVAKWNRERQAHLDTRSDGTLTDAAVSRLLAEACSCAYCREHMAEDDKTLDHVVPLSRGGWHSISNVKVCCLACNASKGRRLLTEWPGRAGRGERAAA